MISIFAALLLASLAFSLSTAQWPRWEERTLDCTSPGRADECVLLAENAKVARDPNKYRCRVEPMPQQIWNKLATKTRLACPIACETEADLSVIQKRPVDADACQKYYTYGKYRDGGEWYLWLAESCRANLTTHCRFNDVPFGESVQGGADDGRQPLPSTLSR